ncbi:hypothetical protein SISSUDRAFT_1099780 [Sistotremastrum suecicum HHB10207 ss-3]|uniref:DUF6532 domain-containing protein n=1 Tax=Sistotremastrum suecicum HHB10207 ss-3 TaxID=1314776 RepID=A0A165X063_9AGAM|nr:hypothetical protein SISSUDRAFT_1099780 [Sistotremastrum suecicum HHB10207 ss-3]
MAPKKGSQLTAAKNKAAQEQVDVEHDHEFAISGNELLQFDELPPAKKPRRGHGNKENQGSIEVSAGIRSSKRLQRLGDKGGGKVHDLDEVTNTTEDRAAEKRKKALPKPRKLKLLEDLSPESEEHDDDDEVLPAKLTSTKAKANEKAKAAKAAKAKETEIMEEFEEEEGHVEASRSSSSIQFIPQVEKTRASHSTRIFSPVPPVSVSHQPVQASQSNGNAGKRKAPSSSNSAGVRTLRETSKPPSKARGEVSSDPIHSSTPPPADHVDNDEESEEVEERVTHAKEKQKTPLFERSVSPERAASSHQHTYGRLPANNQVTSARPSPHLSESRPRSGRSRSPDRRRNQSSERYKERPTAVARASNPPDAAIAKSKDNRLKEALRQEDDEDEEDEMEVDEHEGEDKWIAEGRPIMKVRRIRGPEWPNDVDPFYGPVKGKLIPRRHPSVTKGKVFVNQYHPTCKKYLERAYIYLCFLLTTKSAFPGATKGREYAAWAWVRTMESYGVNYGYDDAILDNITSRIASFRGDVKAAAKQQLAVYGLGLNTETTKTMEKNRKTVHALLKDQRFTYKDPHDPTCLLWYYNRAIKGVLQNSIFKENKVGHYFQREFRKRFHTSMVALAATALQYQLTEYNLGFKKGEDFLHDKNSDIFKRHMATLENIGSENKAALVKLASTTLRDLFCNLAPIEDPSEDVESMLEHEETRLVAEAMAAAIDSEASSDDELVEDDGSYYIAFNLIDRAVLHLFYSAGPDSEGPNQDFERRILISAVAINSLSSGYQAATKRLLIPNPGSRALIESVPNPDSSSRSDRYQIRDAAQ